MSDNFKTRSGTDRRKCGYIVYVPERRSGKDRRKEFNISELSRYETRRIGEYEWHKISEKKVMERLVNCFDPLYPAIARILRGEEIITSKEVYRIVK